jgi:hypothetical protein
MQIMVINLDIDNVINVIDGIDACNSIDVNPLQFTFFKYKQSACGGIMSNPATRIPYSPWSNSPSFVKLSIT